MDENFDQKKAELNDRNVFNISTVFCWLTNILNGNLIR